MSRPWTPENVITTENASNAISDQFPQLRPVFAKPLGTGWDNSAFLVNEILVFRFPRRQVALDLLNTERLLLPKIADKLPIPVPRPQYFGQPGEYFPWCFSGYLYLPGVSACSFTWGEEQRQRLTRPLAKFLAALHAISTQEAPKWGIGPDRFDKLNFSERLPLLEKNLETLLRLNLIRDLRPLLAIAEEGAPPLRLESVVVHGDLYARHLIVDSTGNLSGIIDWGDAHLADPATDLSVAHLLLPPTQLHDFRRHYGEISEARWKLSRLRALSHASVISNYGYEIQDHQLLNAGTISLDYIGRGFQGSV